MADVWKVIDYEGKKRFYEDQKTFERNLIRHAAYERAHSSLMGPDITGKTLAFIFSNQNWVAVDIRQYEPQIQTYIQKNFK